MRYTSGSEPDAHTNGIEGLNPSTSTSIRGNGGMARRDGFKPRCPEGRASWNLASPTIIRRCAGTSRQARLKNEWRNPYGCNSLHRYTICSVRLTVRTRHSQCRNLSSILRRSTLFVKDC